MWLGSIVAVVVAQACSSAFRSTQELLYAAGMTAKEKKKKELEGAPIVALWVKNLTSIHEEVGSIPDLSQWVKDPMLLHADM